MLEATIIFGIIGLIFWALDRRRDRGVCKHPFDGSTLIETITLPAHRYTDSEFLYTVHVRECGLCRKHFIDEGSEFKDEAPATEEIHIARDVVAAAAKLHTHPDKERCLFKHPKAAHVIVDRPTYEILQAAVSRYKAPQSKATAINELKGDKHDSTD